MDDHHHPSSASGRTADSPSLSHGFVRNREMPLPKGTARISETLNESVEHMAMTELLLFARDITNT
jgi:hypothetical protein